MNDIYPFVGLVGQEPLKTALLLGAIDPSLGGVLIRGEKGTAKSTAARGLARLLPPIQVVDGCPFRCDPQRPWAECPSCSESEGRTSSEAPTPHVDLPLGATEDRVLGTLDLERVLKEGRTVLKPGLLAQAHRGILYIDEVNLLPDHLVDVLLDVATSGVNSVQRDGVSARHPARFLLVGSMNPEEGELRPQLLDRFGLMVEVASPRDFELRAEVVRRRLDFERDPLGFADRWSAEDRALGDRVADARRRLVEVAVPDGLLTAITRLCCESEVEGMRADLALYKASRAFASLEGRSLVQRSDLRAVAEFVLPHRRRRQPFQQPGLDRDAIDRALGPAEEQSRDERGGQGSEPGDSETSSEPEPSATSGEDETGSARGIDDRVFAPADPIESTGLELDPRKRRQSGSPGTHPIRKSGSRGAFVRAVRDDSPRELAVDATLRSASLRSGGFGVPTIERGDLHGKEREARVTTLVLFVVDTSGSMGARRRMETVKAAVVGLLGDAYRSRDRVAVVAFRGPRAEIALEPSRGVDLAESALRQLPTGGRTPLAHALALAVEIIARERQSGPVLVVLLTDGKANVPLPGADGDPWLQAIDLARVIGETGASAVVFDTEEGFGRLGRAAELAQAMGADRLPLADLSAGSIRSRLELPGMYGGRP